MTANPYDELFQPLLDGIRDRHDRVESFVTHLSRLYGQYVNASDHAFLEFQANLVRLLDSDMKQNAGATQHFLDRAINSAPQQPYPPVPTPPAPPTGISPETMARRFVPGGARAQTMAQH